MIIATPSQLDLVMDALVRNGVEVSGLEIDHTHPQTQAPSDVVAVGGFVWAPIYRRFYPKLFRWRANDKRFAVLLRPKIVGHGSDVREDNRDMVERLVSAIRQSVRTPPPQLRP